MPRGSIFIGRPSILGNPWRGADAVEAYRRFVNEVLLHGDCPPQIDEIERGLQVERVFEKPIKQWRRLRIRLRNLNVVDLFACWCSKDKPCHGDVLADLVNKTPD